MRSHNARLALAFTALCAGLVTALLVIVTPSLASGGAADDEITACVKNSNGQMRIPRNEKCRNNEHPLVWSKNGPVGESPLAVNLRERQQTVTISPTGNGEPFSVSSSCETGEVVVGGGQTGYDVGVKSLEFVASGPFSDGTTSGWYVAWINEGSEPVTTSASVGALCVRGTINNVALD